MHIAYGCGAFQALDEFTRGYPLSIKSEEAARFDCEQIVRACSRGDCGIPVTMWLRDICRSWWCLVVLGRDNGNGVSAPRKVEYAER